MSAKVTAADRPGGAELLALARRTLLEELLPSLPDEKRYQALMLANALAIVGRELAQPRDEDKDGLERLAAAIRAGEHDGDGALYKRLLAWSEARVAITNPKALGGKT